MKSQNLAGLVVAVAAAWVGVTHAPSSEAQPGPSASAACVVPYTVTDKSSVVEGYVRVSSLITNMIPFVPKSNTGVDLEMFKAELRAIVAGEALQAVLDVREAYVDCLIKKYPDKKDHIIELANEYDTIALQAWLPSNFANFEAGRPIQDFLRDRASKPHPILDSIDPAKRLTVAEITAALGKPDFQSQFVALKGGHVNLVSLIEGGGCDSVVKASLASVDGATLATMGSLQSVLGDLATPGRRMMAYNRILTNAQSSINANTAANLANTMIKVVGAGVDKLESCMLRSRDAAVNIVNANVQTTVTR